MENFADYGARLAEIEAGASNPVEAPKEEAEAAQSLPQEPEIVEERTETEAIAPATPEQGEEPKPVETQPQLHKIKVNGKEKEVSYEDLVALAQKGDDYSYRMEQIRAKATELDAVKPFVDALTNNQAFREYVAQFGRPQQQPQAQASDDPVDQFREEIKARVLEELKPKVEAPVQQLQQQVVSSQILAKVQADDPDGAVRKEMENYVHSLPGHIEFIQLPDGRRVADPSRSFGARFREYATLDSNPNEFLSVYAMCRDRVRSAPVQPAQQQPVKPTAVTTKAPILEGAGGEVTDSGAQTRRQELQRLREQAQGGDLAAAGRVLDLLQNKKR